MAFEFRTEIFPQESTHKISLESKIFTIGSCFSSVFGEFFQDMRLNCISNPFGTLFNPLSMSKLIRDSLSNTELNQDLFCERDGLYFHYDLHSCINSKSKTELQDKFENKKKAASVFLSQADFLIITFGSAMAYQLTETGQNVANCHKKPATFFSKKLLSTEEVLEEYVQLLEELKKLNPKLRIILTVSPVRHLKETLEINSVSKSILRLVAHLLTSKFENIHYFPGYEIMNDDLRDYRFFKSDLLHPSEMAEDYIIDKFKTIFFDKNLQDFSNKWKKLKASLNHKVMNEGSEQHRIFLENLLKELKSISHNLNFSKEINDIETKLLSF